MPRRPGSVKISNNKWETEMGMRTEMAIEAWRKKAGLNAPPPAICKLWNKLQDKAVETIKIAELEKSGIRDGAGYWIGSDALRAIWNELRSAISELESAYKAEWEAL